MEKIETVLTVYHDGQFFSAVIETQSEAGCRAARRVFAAEPSGPELLELVCREYATWKFGEVTEAGGSLMPRANNPKRRQREASRAQQKAGPSTHAQAALAAQREANGATAKRRNAQDKRQRTKEQYALRAQKKKQKHRGR